MVAKNFLVAAEGGDFESPAYIARMARIIEVGAAVVPAASSAIGAAFSAVSGALGGDPLPVVADEALKGAEIGVLAGTLLYTFVGSLAGKAILDSSIYNAAKKEGKAAVGRYLLSLATVPSGQG